MEQTPQYPKFYRAGNLCIKRLGDLNTTEIVVPEHGQQLPLSHQNSTYPDKPRLDEYLAKFEEVTLETYEGFLSDFFRAAHSNRQKFNEYKDLRFRSAQPAINKPTI